LQYRPFFDITQLIENITLSVQLRRALPMFVYFPLPGRFFDVLGPGTILSRLKHLDITKKNSRGCRDGIRSPEFSAYYLL
jgi:hypothetical protein